MMKKTPYWIGAAVAVVVYAGAYGTLRRTYAVTHHSNADHGFEEKRSPGHFVHATCANRAAERILEIMFWPLMRTEEIVHDWRGVGG